MLVDRSIKDQIYGQTSANWHAYMDDGFQHFLGKSEQYWRNLILETFKGNRVMVKAKPSKSFKIEKERLKKQKEKLGEKGLEEAKKLLEDAVAKKNKPPQDVLMKMPMADASKIVFRNLESFNYTTSEQPREFALKASPYPFYLDNVASQFVQMMVFFDTKHVSLEDKPYLDLLSAVWMQSPERDGTETMELKDVLKKRQKNTLVLYNYIGAHNSPFIMAFKAKSNMEKYPLAVQTMKEAIQNIVLDPDRIKTTLKKTINGFSSKKTSTEKVAKALFSRMKYEDEIVANFLTQYNFAKETLKQMEEDPDVVLKRLEKIRKSIVQPKHMFAYMAAGKEYFKEYLLNTLV